MRLLISLVLLFTFSPYVGALTSLDRAELSFPNSLQDSNPGFESGTVKWTGSGGTFTINSTAADQFVAGSKQFAVWDSDGAAQERCSALVKVPESGNCAVSLTYKVPSGTATHKIVAKDGSKDLAIEDVVSSTSAMKHEVEFPCASAASNQARVCLRSVASNEPAIQFDGGYAGYARLVGMANAKTPWAAYTPIISNLGTGSVASSFGQWRQDGDSAEVMYNWTKDGSGGSGASTVQISPPATCTVDTSKLPNGASSASGEAYSSLSTDIVQMVGASGGFYVKRDTVANITGADVTSGSNWRGSFRVPCVGWTASNVVTSNQQRAPKVTRYTSGSGTHTTTLGTTYMEVLVVGGGGGGGSSGTGSLNNGIAGNASTFGTSFISGGAGGGGSASGNTGTGGSASITGSSASGTIVNGSIGGGAAYQNTVATGIQGGQGGGTCIGQGGGGGAYGTAGQAAPANSGGGGGGGGGTSTTSGFYSGAGGGGGGCVKAIIPSPLASYAYSVGSGGAGGGAGTSGYAGGAGAAGYIQVTEYFGYTTAILANSVSSSVTNGARMIWASVKSVCSSNPCTIGAQSGDFTSITRSGTGAYQANFNAGTFSGTPVCTCSTVGALDGHCSAYSSTTSISTVRTYTPAGASQDGYIEMMCIGPR